MEIEETHKRNFKLIKKYNLKSGDKLKFKKDCASFNGFYKKGEIFTISHIHFLYGWITFKETERLPQEAEKLLSFIDTKELIKLKIIENLN